jgi:hypothetical protein
MDRMETPLTFLLHQHCRENEWRLDTIHFGFGLLH